MWIEKKHEDRVRFAIDHLDKDGIMRVWRKVNSGNDYANTISIVKHSGWSIMIWGYMSARGVGNIHFINGIRDKCNDILKKNVKQSAIKMGMPNIYMIQQDKNSKRSAEFNRQWLIWNIPKQLNMPTQSLHLNPIEHLWAIFEKGVHKVSIKSKDHLKRVVIQE